VWLNIKVSIRKIIPEVYCRYTKMAIARVRRRPTENRKIKIDHGEH